MNMHDRNVLNEIYVNAWNGWCVTVKKRKKCIDCSKSPTEKSIYVLDNGSRFSKFLI